MVDLLKEPTYKWVMADILPQQRLFLELLVKSGDIGVSDTDDGSMLYRTMKECEKAGWVTVKGFCPGFDKAAITAIGRNKVKVT